MTYDPRKDGAESYNEAIKVIRMQKIRAGEINPIVREVTIGNARLLQGDCAEIMLTLEPVDLCLTDPPYGIDYGNAGGFSENSGWKNWRGQAEWDIQRPSKSVFDTIAAISKDQMIWGGNYFADMLPPSMGWLIWDKGQRGFSLADFEMAWTSRQKASRIFTYGRGNEKGFAPGSKEPTRFLNAHPTQKPLAVMQWCLGFLPDAETVLDCFAGSGTTGVACVKLGRKFIGIEKDPTYFDVMVDRITKAYAQPDFFIAPPEPKPVQEELL